MEIDKSSFSLGGGYGGSSKAFKCPNCCGFASHFWEYKPVVIQQRYSDTIRFNIISQCQACEQFCIWLTNKHPLKAESSKPYTQINLNDVTTKLLFPESTLGVPEPNDDMPSDVKEIFIEAGQILDKSPRASAALSRLAIEKLVDFLGAEGKDLNNKIGDLVSKGMPIVIQQMLDSVRVIGNNAVHPGQIDIKDDKNLARSLLDFINLIIDNQITQPKKISEVYNSLPESYRNAINNRDN